MTNNDGCGPADSEIKNGLSTQELSKGLVMDQSGASWALPPVEKDSFHPAKEASPTKEREGSASTVEAGVGHGGGVSGMLAIWGWAGDEGVYFFKFYL
jgi:hypothetical protein